jgi:hypothetical protein
MIKALKERGPETPILEVMQDDVPTVSSRAKLDTAFRSLMQRRRPVADYDSEGCFRRSAASQNVTHDTQCGSVRRRLVAQSIDLNFKTVVPRANTENCKGRGLSEHP